MRVADGTYTDNVVWPEVLGREPSIVAAAPHQPHTCEVDEETFAASSSHATCDTCTEDFSLTAAAAAALRAASQDPVTEGCLDGARDFAGLPANPDSTTSWDPAPSDATVSASVEQPLGPPGLRYPLRFETQDAMLCGRRALNNALGGEETFHNSDLSAACDVVIAESWIPDDNGRLSDPQDRADHKLANGWYSEAVLAMVLRRTMQYPLLLHNHWVALKRVDGHIWLLDSCHTPVRLTDDAYLAFIRAHEFSYPVERL